jgi:SAM-dependent methyltransferase
VTAAYGAVAEQLRAGAALRRCPLCDGVARRAFVASDLNRRASDERFEYARCRSCGTYFLVVPPSDMSIYYPTEYYTLTSADALDAVAEFERYKVDMLLEHIRPGRLVEIGSGEGGFARAAQNAGFDVTAIEVDSRACEHLREVVGVHAIESAAPEEVLPNLPPSRAIVLWHVLEHLPRPRHVVEQAARNLEPEGVLAVATPNPTSLQFKLFGRRWAHLDAPRHHFLIPAEALAARCADLGLRLAATTTTDPGGRHWNAFGWEYLLRRAPRSSRAGRGMGVVAALIARALAPIEERGENGCAYTSVFVKDSG